MDLISPSKLRECTSFFEIHSFLVFRLQTIAILYVFCLPKHKFKSTHSIIEPVSHLEALKSTMTLNSFLLQYRDATLKFLNNKFK